MRQAGLPLGDASSDPPTCGNKVVQRRATYHAIDPTYVVTRKWMDSVVRSLSMSASRSKSAVVVDSFVRSGGSPPSSAPPLQPPLLIPVAEAARLLSVSTWEIRRLCRKGALGYKKLGRTKWLITSRSIQNFASEVSR